MSNAAAPNPPFDIIHCSWPRPVRQEADRWVSAPEWDAPPMPVLPQPRWVVIHGQPCWTVDWCDWFSADLRRYDDRVGAEMRGFHVVFHLRINAGGTLWFNDDDGSIIRRDGQILHEDRTSHPLTTHHVEVREGDRLEVAQWQNHGAWVWGARLELHPAPVALMPFRDAASRRLADARVNTVGGSPVGGGPPLKLFTNGAHPLRAAVSVLSMVLNGYCPSQVLLYGESQWSTSARRMFADLLPFARIVPTEEAIESIAAAVSGARGAKLASWARRHWFVMKTCAGLLLSPREACMIDDDVFILGPVDDALAAFSSGEADLVFAPDIDHGTRYRATWSAVATPGSRKRVRRRSGTVAADAAPLATGTFNAALYWVRPRRSPASIAADMLRVPPDPTNPMDWEQGFIASEYASGGRTCRLPSQRYFYPFFDGLPGGVDGYDYAANPCGFASIHFGALRHKPDDLTTLNLVPQLFARAILAHD
jgi:hypothetical protein